MRREKQALESALQSCREEIRSQAAIKDQQISRLETELRTFRREFCNSDIANVDGVTSSLFVALYEQAWEEMRLFVKELSTSEGKTLDRAQCLKLVHDVLFENFAAEYFGIKGSGLLPPDERRKAFERVRHAFLL